MDIQTVIFYGRSGAGKGTQAVLLKKYLEEHDERHETLYFQTGDGLRELAEMDTPAGRLTKETLDHGGLMPTLLVVWMWGDFFIQNVDENKHLVLDGVARRPEEAPLVDSALRFFKRQNPAIVIIDVPKEVAFERLKERARDDDTDANINKRLDWYDETSVKAIECFKKYEGYNILTMDGTRPIETVHEDILRGLGIK